MSDRNPNGSCRANEQAVPCLQPSDGGEAEAQQAVSTCGARFRLSG